MHYSIWSLINQALTGNRNWAPVWRDPEPKSHYDLVIVGGGGHGLATAGLDLAILAVTQPLFDQIIFLMATNLFTKNHYSFGKGLSRISTIMQ